MITTAMYLATILIIALYALTLAQRPLPGCHDLAALVREVGKAIGDVLRFYVPRLGGDDTAAADSTNEDVEDETADADESH